MADAGDIYDFWLKPHHLPGDGSSREATISAAVIRELHPRPTEVKRYVVLSFEGRPHKLIVNQSNANRLFVLAGNSTLLEKWVGLTVKLRRVKPQGSAKETIIIE